MLEIIKEYEGTPYFEPYLDNIAQAFIHILETAVKPEKHYQRFWQLLHQTKILALLHDQ